MLCNVIQKIMFRNILPKLMNVDVKGVKSHFKHQNINIKDCYILSQKTI